RHPDVWGASRRACACARLCVPPVGWCWTATRTRPEEYPMARAAPSGTRGGSCGEEPRTRRSWDRAERQRAEGQRAEGHRAECQRAECQRVECQKNPDALEAAALLWARSSHVSWGRCARSLPLGRALLARAFLAGALQASHRKSLSRV